MARQWLMPVAQHGLLHRPVHLLVGELPWAECVSPYTRDLTITLDQFARSKSEWSSGLPLKPNEPSLQANWYYTVARRFVSSRTELREEKKRVDKQFGCQPFGLRETSYWIDSARLDWQAVDPRLLALANELPSPKPLWLVLSPTRFDEPFTIAQAVSDILGPTLQSVSFCHNSTKANIDTRAAQYRYHGKATATENYAGAVETLEQTICPKKTTQEQAKPETLASPKLSQFRIKA